jgi:hypothetical protein
MKTMMRFAVLLSLVVLVVAAVPQTAQANCEYPHRITIHYWGWPATDGSTFCTYPLIGPWTPRVIVGEQIIDCDGTTTSWGDLSCRDSTTTTVESCPPVCD